ncbi:methyltransferase domain-containing protein [Lysobacter enzymogenes]|uniref:Methyltransferase domain-containing protein n=1 Tax=Lysobacter enzymogenes TaxID=69 RepID=A0A3N2RDR6_LYSEN|nr:methyltransferase domain-containing protein [Lysobacter enzymogenes]ROU05585.1 methyltransferase domain-containing protein [Lysobacter enzymogenes]
MPSTASASVPDPDPDSDPAAFRPRFDIGAQRMDCGREPHVDTHQAADERASWPLLDYSGCEPTDDQAAINRWLQGASLDGADVLHVGTGNSSVARLLDGRARVVSVTVARGEFEHAQSLGLRDYRVHLLNKHGLEFGERFAAASFDCILDNNLASFACCQRHLERYFDALARLLRPRGFVLTHWQGMQWTLDVGVDDVEPVWRLDADKLEAIAAAFGLATTREGELFFLRRAARG